MSTYHIKSILLIYSNPQKGDGSMNYFVYQQDKFVKVEDDGRKILGVDINPEKGCIFNCITCNRGCTKRQGEWHDFGPVDDSLKMLGDKIKEEKPDLVEIYGQGDVLTNVHLEDTIDFVHSLDVPVRLVSNSYLLGVGDHMKAALKCEEVVGAFGIVDEDCFKKYHRPLDTMHFSAAQQTESLINFTKNYTGKFKVRVFISKGFNDSEENLKEIKSILNSIKYDSLWVATTNKLSVSSEREAEIRKFLEW